MSRELISVIIPVHNCERYVGECIESVLGQTYPHVEVIVVNDASSDSTEDVLKGYEPQIRRLSQERTGVGGALNNGVNLAQGNLLSFLAADDLWASDKLEHQFQALMSDETLDMVFGYVQNFISPDVTEEDREKWFCPEDPMPGLTFGTLLIRRASFSRVGPFETKWHFGEFVDWFGRAEELGLRHRMLPEVVYRRRIHGSNMTIRERHSQRDYLHIVKSALDRRRASGNSKSS